VTDVITIANKGLNPLTILGYAYSTSVGGAYVNCSSMNGIWDLG